MSPMTNRVPVGVVLPIQTKSLLNVRWHWARKAKLAAQQRGLVLMALRAPLAPFRLPAAKPVPKTRPRGPVAPALALLEVMLVRIAPRALDDDNLRGALKAVRDGAADALGVDDRDPRVAWRYDQWRGEPRQYAVSVSLRCLTSAGS